MNVYLENAKKIQKELIQNRRILHKNPEVNSDLKNTRKFVQKKLDEYGILSEVCQSGGIKACIGKNQGGKVFLLRADMDALPVQEKSGEDFSSLNGKMHACGHDLHTAMLLGAAKLLKEQEEQLKGTVKIMFQEDEEGMTGAQNMVETGILLNPPVDAAMALHVIPGDMKVGVYCCNNGYTSSAIDVFRITVRGKGAHGI